MASRDGKNLELYSLDERKKVVVLGIFPAGTENSPLVDAMLDLAEAYMEMHGIVSADSFFARHYFTELLDF
jgi:hypothetical protein